MDWKKLLEAFTKALTEALVEAGEDKEKKSDVLKEALGALPADARNHLTQIGYSAAHAQATEKEKQLKQASETAEEARKNAEEQLAKALESAPDSKKIRDEYEIKLREIAKKHDEEIASITGELGQTIGQMALTNLERSLIELNVKAPFAKYRVKDPDVARRLKVDGREVKFYLDDGVTPMAPPSDGKTHYDQLAADIVKTINSDFIESNVGGGSGARGETGRNGAATGVAKVAKETIEANAKARAERPNPLLPKKA